MTTTVAAVVRREQALHDLTTPTRTFVDGGEFGKREGAVPASAFDRGSRRTKEVGEVVNEENVWNERRFRLKVAIRWHGNVF